MQMSGDEAKGMEQSRHRRNLPHRLLLPEVLVLGQHGPVLVCQRRKSICRRPEDGLERRLTAAAGYPGRIGGEGSHQAHGGGRLIGPLPPLCPSSPAPPPCTSHKPWTAPDCNAAPTLSLLGTTATLTLYRGW